MRIATAVDRFFAISSRGSTFGAELRGGAVTFVAMSYIVVLNPRILGEKPDVLGRILPVGQVAAVTALVAGVMCLVVIEGALIVLLGVTGLRTAVFHAIPPELRAAIAAGIGCFITLIGLVDSGFVRRIPDAADTTVPLGLGVAGSIATLPTLVFVVGLGLMAVLVARKVRGGILISIVT